MNLQEAKKLVGSRAIWELKNMQRALSFAEALNTPEENKILEAVKILLKN